MAGCAGVANATQITLGNSDPGDVYNFQGNGAGSLTVSVDPKVKGTNQAFYGGDVGNYKFGPTSFLAGPLVGGNFPSNGTESLKVAFTDGDTASGDVNWTLVKDHSLRPDLIGTWTVASASGDAAFLADFSPGSIADIDIVVVATKFLDTLSM